ncbi:MAG: hypothetical protein U9Q07_04105 [Planctomycetota bacterium]|nr:hypothetical protein [Planctomycetota bacterium]
MKRISCPRCKTKFKLLSAGNTDGAEYVVSKARRRGGGQRLRKVTNGSKYQMVLSCKCRPAEKSRTLLTIIGRSKAHAITMLRRWRDQQVKTISQEKKAVVS